MDGKSAATSPTEYLKKVLECKTLAEAQSTVISIMKRKGVRWRPPLMLVKALMSGDWCNGDVDSPSKLSFFFMNPSVSVDYEENLRLQLRSSEGKGLSDEAITAMMKKDLFVLMNNYELRDAVRIGTVFSKCFWNNCMVTNELKT